jgi:hypothetical protein
MVIDIPSPDAAPVPAASSFDYATLDDSTRVVVEAARDQIRLLEKRTLETWIAMGQQLLVIEAALRGKFEHWLAAEWDYHRATAYRLMHMVRVFGDRVANCDIGVSTLYELAAEHVPEHVRDAVLAESKVRHVTLAEVKARVTKMRATTDTHKPKPTIAQYRARHKAYDALRDDLDGISFRLAWLNTHGGLGAMAQHWGPSLRKPIEWHISKLIKELTTVRKAFVNAPYVDPVDQAYLSAELRASLREADTRAAARARANERENRKKAREHASAQAKAARAQRRAEAAVKATVKTAVKEAIKREQALCREAVKQAIKQERAKVRAAKQKRASNASRGDVVS